MTYFSLLLGHNQPINRLQKAALELLRSRSNLLVEGSAGFLESLRQEIKFLVDEHPRCAPLHYSTFDGSEGSIGVSLGMNYTVDFKLYPVKKEAA